jgi:hypothetical protein
MYDGMANQFQNLSVQELLDKLMEYTRLYTGLRYNYRANVDKQTLRPTLDQLLFLIQLKNRHRRNGENLSQSR